VCEHINCRHTTLSVLSTKSIPDDRSDNIQLAKMRWTGIVSTLLLSGTAEAAGRSIAHAGKRHVEHAAKRATPAVVVDHGPLLDREAAPHKFLNANTTSEHSIKLRMA
jgi:hypothetical protein